MAAATYIPVGRTSLVKKGDLALQVQTEYAPRPYPRITTSVLNNGQIIHKIARRLDHVVESLEEQNAIEAAMKQQHNEVLALINKDMAENKLKTADEQAATNKKIIIRQRLNSLEGFKHVYHLDPDGTFHNKKALKQFKKSFGFFYKNLPEILDVFPLIPGKELVREKGVYEVEPDKLYYVSLGSECFFVTFEPPDELMNYEYEYSLKQIFLDL